VFLGTHQNRFDAKGRVSIPAGFRTALRALGVEGEPLVILRPSHIHPCIDAWPASAFATLAQPLGEIDVFSDEYEDMAAALYADAHPIDPDREGRIVLPESLRAHAGLADSVTFMGLGRIFQIWEPAAAEARRHQARERSRRGAQTPAGAP